MKKRDMYWLTNNDWWDVVNGVPTIKPNAPVQAQESYKRFVMQTEESDDDIVE